MGQGWRSVSTASSSFKFVSGTNANSSVRRLSPQNLHRGNRNRPTSAASLADRAAALITIARWSLCWQRSANLPLLAQRVAAAVCRLLLLPLLVGSLCYKKVER